ncbi:DUF4352 domain-containing protein [Enteractinococcus coprophilus]|uniref:DUF4352 domain-containing protein n=1 Tax=Enteractinococcus coprophilus TaxID=1027633 RepID=A0A542ZYQ7_9MICC|nr:DUF4352 domain-containing protein [Enteractinococcus coprophilus]TQL65481.1 hypothetical protein FB556_2676 [Enteractinococcus coprophilus]
MTTDTEFRPVQSQAQPPKQRNVIGLIALVTAIVGAVFALIPGAMILGWILLPIAFILSIVSLFMKNQKRGQGIAALIISIVGTFIGMIVFIGVVGSAVDEAFNEETQIQSPIDGAEMQEPEDIVVDEDAAESADADAEDGTRANPLAIGSTISDSEWEVTINSVDLDATDVIMAENPFNEAPADGNVYIMVEVSATYTGTDPEGETPWVTVEYVSAGGNSFASHDSMVVAPNSFDSLETLYEGASATGNISLEVPEDEIADGTLKVSPGLFSDAVFFTVQ